MKSWFEKAKENAKIVGGVIQKKAEAGLGTRNFKLLLLLLTPHSLLPLLCKF
jgi:hypothetical protein